MSTRKLLAAGIFLLSAASAACAQTYPDEREYADLGRWRVISVTTNGAFHYCAADSDNGRVQLRLATDGNRWQMGNPYYGANGPVRGHIGFGQYLQPVTFMADGDGWASLDADAFADDLRNGSQVRMVLDRGEQAFSLSGSSAAMAKARECAVNQGRPPARRQTPVVREVPPPSAGGTNAYGGYDIAGMPGASERFYGETRGWTVLSGTVNGRFGYCVAERSDNGGVWRLGRDLTVDGSTQWQLAVPYQAMPDWSGQIEVDGDVRPTGGSAAGPWTFVWLQMSDLDRIRNGNTMILDIHRASLDFQLRGTAAAITKIEECVTQGRRGGMYATNRPSPMPPRPGGKQSSRAGLPVPNCPDGGPTLPVTGICQGQASDYLLNTSNPNDYLLPDPSCDWVVNEAQMIDGVLLYKALRCKGITTQLEYGGGAHYATLDSTRSALWADNGGTPQGETRVVWITHVDPSNPIPNLLRASRDGMDQPMPGVKCVLKRKDNGDGWVYAPDAATMAAQDGPTPPMCGSFSEGDGVDRWWRVVADFGMLIDLPGEAYQDFDPSSLTLLRKSPAGDWQVAY